MKARILLALLALLALLVLSSISLSACVGDAGDSQSRDTLVASDGSTDANDDSSSDASTDSADASAPVDTSGACGVICQGGEQMCVVEGFDPADGIETCVRACQAEWPNELNCAGPASDLLVCVDANGSCTKLDDDTCGGDLPMSWLRALRECVAAP